MFDVLRIDMNKVYPVLVVATMSSGKSTLINSLVGESLLPSMNKATTAKAVAILDNDAKKGFEIHAVDRAGRYSNIKKASGDVVKRYNDTNELSEMIIEGDVRGIKNSIKALLLIDTPGINNAADITHGQVTNEVLNEYKEGLILYVINATQQATYDDSDFLNLIAAKVKAEKNFNIIFVINKMDRIDRSKEDPYMVINESKRYIESKGIDKPTIIPVCSKAALIFKKVLSGHKLSETEEEDFFIMYKRFGRKGYSLTDYAYLPETGSLSDEIYIDGKKYTKAQIYGALDGTGIPRLEEVIDTALVSSLKLKAPQITAETKQTYKAADTSQTCSKPEYNSGRGYSGLKHGKKKEEKKQENSSASGNITFQELLNELYDIENQIEGNI